MDIPPAHPPTPDDHGTSEDTPPAPHADPPGPSGPSAPPGPPHVPPPYGANPYDVKGGQHGGNPYGPDPYEQNPYEQNPYGHNSYGQNSYGQDPYSQNPYGQIPYQNPYEQNPYAPGGPQGYWNAGWYGPPRTTNGLAIAALVVSLVAWCVPLLGLIFGIVALRQIRRTGQGGRGMAVAGIVINSLGTVLVAVLITLGVIGALDDGNTDVQDLRPGQCFNTVGSSLSDYSGGGHRSTRVDVVPCRDEHDAEAYAVFTLDPGDYPGVDRISQLSDERCSHLAQNYLGDATLPDGMEIYYYLPPHDGWDRGDRSVTCFFGSRGERVTGSVTSSGQSSGIGV